MVKIFVFLDIEQISADFGLKRFETGSPDNTLIVNIILLAAEKVKFLESPGKTGGLPMFNYSAMAMRYAPKKIIKPAENLIILFFSFNTWPPKNTAKTMLSCLNPTI